MNGMNTRLQGRTIIVTGAAGGIGRAVSERIAHEGGTVVGFDRPGAKPSEAVTEMLEGDVALVADAARTVQTTIDLTGRCDGLVNGAGIIGPTGRLHTIAEEDWGKVLTVNLTATWVWLRAVIPVLLDQSSGSVVNISSVAGLGSSARVAPYGVSKAGVASLTKTAAVEYASEGIRVNAVCPGPVDTNMLRDLEQLQARGASVQQGSDRIRRAVPMRRYGSPEEVAASVAFLLSDDASYITGAMLSVDGGMRSV